MNKKNILLYCIIAILIIIGLSQACHYQKKQDDLLSQISQYQLGEKAFTKKINADSSTIVQQEQTILTEKEAIKLGLLKLEGEIKKPQSQVRQTQVIRYDSISVAYVPDNFIDSSKWLFKFKKGFKSNDVIDSLIANSIIVPKSFATKSKWFSINGKVNKENVLIETLSIPNESSVTVGWKRTGFLWLGKKPFVEVKNTNPYLSVVKLSNVVIEKKKGLLSKPIFWVAVGVVAGFLIK